jgi:probable HAF family extracellular repeat protein
MPLKPLAATCVSLACLLATPLADAALPSYRAQLLYPGYWVDLSDLNDVGQITAATGNYGQFFQASVYTSGQWRGLGTLGGGDSVPTSINNAGHVVGYSRPPSDGPYHAFVYDGRSMRDIHPTGADESYASAINDKGQVAGTWATWSETSITNHAFIYSNGSLQTIGLGRATDLNQAGQVTGTAPASDALYDSQAFIYDDDGLRLLGTLGGLYSYGTAINAAGHVVGQSSVAGGPSWDGRAFWHDGMSMHDLGTLGGTHSAALDVNDAGDIVGWSEGPNSGSSFDHRAFLYRDGQMHSLADLITTDFAARVELNQAVAINEAGHILVAGAYDGHNVGFLLTPVPEPGTYALLLAGLSLMVVRQRARPVPTDSPAC